jgi:hypothetical protein
VCKCAEVDGEVQIERESAVETVGKIEHRADVRESLGGIGGRRRTLQTAMPPLPISKMTFFKIRVQSWQRNASWMATNLFQYDMI